MSLDYRLFRCPECGEQYLHPEQADACERTHDTERGRR